jgi:hypothetical protein
MRIGIAVAMAGALLGASGAARAADRVAVFAFEGTALPPEVEAAPLGLSKAMRDRLAGAGRAPLEPALTLPDMRAAVGCMAMDGTCATKIGAYLGVTHLVVGRLSADAGGVRVRIEVWRTLDGALETAVEEVLPASVAGLTASFEALALKAATPTAAALPGPYPVHDAPAPVPLPPAAPPEPLFGPHAVPGLALAGAGVVLLAISLGTGLHTAALRDDSDASPHETIADFEAALVLERRGKRSAWFTTAFLAGGAGAVLVGSALFGLHAAARKVRTSPSLALALDDGPRVLLRVPFGDAADAP